MTGATGKTGSVVVAELLKAGYPGRSAVILFGGVCPRKGGVKNLLCKITNVIFGEDYAQIESRKTMKLLFPLLMSMLPAASVAQSQLPSPQPNNLNLPFVLSVIGAFIASFVVAKLYVWPTLRSLPRYNALRILASLHAFRFLGMNFIVIGFVSPALSSAVGDQIAWGDFVAAVLALFSIAALTWRWAFAIPIVWILNLWGTADLLNAYYKGVTQVADVGLFGAAIYIPALFVPILLTAHMLAFMLLLKRGDVVEQYGNSQSLKDLSHEFQHGPHETR